jgi:hypothetical protein
VPVHEKKMSLLNEGEMDFKKEGGRKFVALGA